MSHPEAPSAYYHFRLRLSPTPGGLPVVDGATLTTQPKSEVWLSEIIPVPGQPRLLDVVFRGEAGIRPYCLHLHGHDANRHRWSWVQQLQQWPDRFPKPH